MKHSNRLRVLRAERRITQVDLAAKARVSTTKLWRAENGYYEPTPNEKKRLARVLKATVDQAFPEPEAVAS